jgi:hypothetical protein
VKHSLVWILPALAFGAACSSTTAEVTPRCILGTKRTCDFGPECAVALEECVSDPPVWGDCECTLKKPPTPEASTSEDGSGTPTSLGQACRSDAECAAGAFCLRRSSGYFFGGGPPKGVCVADCSTGPAVCQKFPGSACVTVSEPGLPPSSGGDAGPKSSDAGLDASVHGADASRDAGAASSHDAADAGHAPVPTALCFHTCSVGGNIGAKCSGAPHVACDEFPSGPASVGYCRPICATNADCSGSPTVDGPARSCDTRRSVCVDKKPGGDPSLGAACNTSEVGSCTGECVTVSRATEITGADAGSAAGGPETTICSHRCVLGDPVDCGGAKNGAFDGACLSKPEGRASGDVGYCRKLCDCPKDCPLDSNGRGQACIRFESSLFADGFGRSGICTPTALATGTPLTCSVGPDR